MSKKTDTTQSMHALELVETCESLKLHFKHHPQL